MVTRNSAPLPANAPHQIGKNHFITDQHAEFHRRRWSWRSCGLFGLKRQDCGTWPSLEIADAFHQLYPRKNSSEDFKRNVFTERHKMLLVVAAEQLPVRRQEIGAVEQNTVCALGRNARPDCRTGAGLRPDSPWRRVVVDRPARVHRRTAWRLPAKPRDRLRIRTIPSDGHNVGAFLRERPDPI